MSQVHESNAVSTAPSSTTATSWASGCSRSRCEPGSVSASRSPSRSWSPLLPRKPPFVQFSTQTIRVLPAWRHPGPDSAGLSRYGPAPCRNAGTGRRVPFLTALPSPTVAPCGWLSELSGKRVDVIHVVGGGVHNTLLCQLTSDACGLACRCRPCRGRGDRKRVSASPGLWSRGSRPLGRQGERRQPIDLHVYHPCRRWHSRVGGRGGRLNPT